MIDDARFEALRDRLGQLHSLSHVLARQIGDVDLSDLRGPADLALIPVLRKSDVAALHRAEPPFGGLAAAPASAFLRLFAPPGGIYEPESAGLYPGGTAKVFAAVGVERGEIVVNCFSYHLTPGGRMLESGAQALGCPVIPAGPGATEQLIAAIAHLRPSVYCGPPDFLKILLDKARGRRRRLLHPRGARLRRGKPVALRPTSEDGIFAVHYCAHRIGDIDLNEANDEACGLVDNAARCPQGPQAQQQQQTVSS